MKVRATKFGFYLHQRQPGDEFEFTGKPSGIWMEPVDDSARKAFKEAGIKVAPLPPPPEPVKSGGGSEEKKEKGHSPVSKKGAGSTGDQEVI